MLSTKRGQGREANTLGMGKSHTIELAKEDFKRRETRQLCGIINYDKIKIKRVKQQPLNSTNSYVQLSFLMF